MGENGNGNGNPTRKDNALPSTAIQFLITYDQVTGALNIQGPIQNCVLVYGVLEAAKEVVKKFIESNQSPIVRPDGLSIVRN